MALQAVAEIFDAEVIGSSLIQKGKLQAFVKLGTGGKESVPTDWLRYEELGLRLIRDRGGPFCPSPWGSGEVTLPIPFSDESVTTPYLVMDYLPFSASAQKTTEDHELLGCQINRLHYPKGDPPDADYVDPDNPGKCFGFEMDGCCGSAPQFNNAEAFRAGQSQDWVEFWRVHRLGAQLAACGERGGEFVDLTVRLMSQLKELFEGSGLRREDITPSLLHGDLWSGNWVVIDGIPCVFDPAAYWGHSEAEFGLARMFGGFCDEFFWANDREETGQELRAMLYELHHHMNHYQIFGSSYRSGCIQLLRSIVKQLPH